MKSLMNKCFLSKGESVLLLFPFARFVYIKTTPEFISLITPNMFCTVVVKIVQEKTMYRGKCLYYHLFLA